MRANTASAFAGVFDSRQAEFAGRLRSRLPTALEPDGSSRRFDDGPLSLAWTEGVSSSEAGGDRILCLLDGHIYNHAELARELGLPDSIQTPALLARGYAAFKDNLLPKLRGDFALLIWDPSSLAGLIARDQLGGRPLFLHRTTTTLAFASEIRNLIRLLPRTPPPDEIAIGHWLVAAPLPSDRSLYESVVPVDPATCVTFCEEGISTTRYWAPRYRRPSGRSAAEAAVAVRAGLELAVSRRSAPASESAVLLSGGIDSASVAGVASSTLPSGVRPPRSYSAVFPKHPDIDEASLIGTIAAHAGLDATGLRLDSGGIMSGALPFLRAWEVPPFAPNLFFLYPLFQRAAQDGVQMMLDGEGGDAVFWYSTGLLADHIRGGRLLSAWSLAGQFPEYGRKTTWRTRLGHLRQWGRRHEVRYRRPRWLTLDTPILVSATDNEVRGDAPRWWSAIVQGILGPGSRMLHDISRRHGALNGIEPRHPLLDVDLIELALTLQPDLAFARRYNRPVLRDAVAGLVPDAARLRPYKSNFDAVFIAAVNADLPVIERLLLARGSQIAAFTDREALAAHLASSPGERAALRDWATKTWHLTTMECWLRQHSGEDLLPAELLPRLVPPGHVFVKL